MLFPVNQESSLCPTTMNVARMNLTIPTNTDTNFNSPTCTSLTISSVIMENEGRCAPHKCHLDADEIRSLRYHQLRKVDGDESDESDEWGLDESEEDEREGPGDLRD